MTRRKLNAAEILAARLIEDGDREGAGMILRELDRISDEPIDVAERLLARAEAEGDLEAAAEIREDLEELARYAGRNFRVRLTTEVEADIRF